ncbi:hypothetical protein, partial [Photobacterium halotolerans]|uniref:hypothetical protein n=1 Tax=Photobacterium halotolerans TaxID=265726 RepID=UPI001F472C1F
PGQHQRNKGISGYCLCQQRVTGARHTAARDTQDSRATYNPQEMMSFQSDSVEFYLALMIFTVDTEVMFS